MNKTIAIGLVPVFAAAMFAQGPPPRGDFFGGFGGGRGGGMLGAGPGPRTVVAGAPYSATETVTSQQTLAGGNQISRTHTSTVARDSQGRISTIETVTPPASSGKAPYTIQTIFDPVAGYRYVLNSSTLIAMQEPLPKMRSASGTPATRPGRSSDARANDARPNEKSASMGTQMVNSVLAAGSQVTETIPAGAIGNAQEIQAVRVSWISNTLQVPVQIKTSDPRFGSTDMELTNIVQGEPNGSLFVVPSGYTIKQGGGRGPGARGGGPGGMAAPWKGGPPPPQ
jgi:hypothetical protein